MYHFPRTKFVSENSLSKQIEHVCSEVREAYVAQATDDLNYIAEELVDVVHSAETALRILQERHGVNIEDVCLLVNAKNHARGYYA